jgi:hypothetical protein
MLPFLVFSVVSNMKVDTYSGNTLDGNQEMLLYILNASDHHWWVIGSLCGLRHQNVVELVQKYDVKFIKNPWADVLAGWIYTRYLDFAEDRGDCARLDIDDDETINLESIGGTASKGKTAAKNEGCGWTLLLRIVMEISEALRRANPSLGTSKHHWKMVQIG